MDDGMAEIKDAAVRADVELLDKLLSDKTPEFCSRAFYYVNIGPFINNLKATAADIKAFEKKHCQISQIFLNHGADVNYYLKLNRNWTTFFSACCNSSASIVKMMIDRADLNSKTDSGILPIQLVFNMEDTDKMHVFLDRGISADDIDRLGLLHKAVGTSMEIVRRLVQLGARVNCIFDHETAILRAVRMKKLEIVEFLIECGADANVTAGKSTLESAVLTKTRRLLNFC